MATRMEEILMTGNQLEYCKALDNYVLNRSERLPLPIGMVFSPKYFQHFKDPDDHEQNGVARKIKISKLRKERF